SSRRFPAFAELRARYRSPKLPLVADARAETFRRRRPEGCRGLLLQHGPHVLAGAFEQRADGVVGQLRLLVANGFEDVAVFLQAMLMMFARARYVEAHLEILAEQIGQGGHEDVVGGDVDRRMEGNVAL